MTTPRATPCTLCGETARDPVSYRSTECPRCMALYMFSRRNEGREDLEEHIQRLQLRIAALGHLLEGKPAREATREAVRERS